MGAELRIVRLLGKPVSASLSPRMQNAAFAEAGLPWRYEALEVEPDGLEAAVRDLDIGGNVTIPHKVAVFDLCDEVDEVAQRAVSVNTLLVRDGRLLGWSTDGLAVIGAVGDGAARRRSCSARAAPRGRSSPRSRWRARR